MNDMDPYLLFMALPANGAGYLVFFFCLMAEFVPRQGIQHTGEMSNSKAKIPVLAVIIPYCSGEGADRNCFVHL